MRNFIVILENPFIEITELIVSAYVVPGNYPLESGEDEAHAQRAKLGFRALRGCFRAFRDAKDLSPSPSPKGGGEPPLSASGRVRGRGPQTQKPPRDRSRRGFADSVRNLSPYPSPKAGGELPLPFREGDGG